MKLVKIMAVLLLVGHWMCCAWYYIGNVDSDILVSVSTRMMALASVAVPLGIHDRLHCLRL